jgi:glycosyltransferase involved in cell wall biosynthesis
MVDFSNKTILQLIPSLKSGGAEMSCIEMSAAISQAGGRALVASSGGAWVHRVERAGGKHILLPLNTKNPFKLRRNAKAIAQLLRDEKIDLVHARSRGPAWSAYWATRQTKTPFVTSFHSAYGYDALIAGGLKKWLKLKYNRVMSYGDRVIVISDYIASHVKNFYDLNEDKIRLIYRGVDLSIFDTDKVSQERMIALSAQWQVPHDKPLLLMPSRLTALKGHEVLIEALARMPHKNWFCVILGAQTPTTPYQQRLEKLVLSRGLGGQIRFAPTCQDIPTAMKLAHVVLYPTQVPEGFGRMPIEAQALGVPVIATALGATVETVRDHGDTGWLVPKGDASALATAIQKALMMQQSEREALAVRAKAWVTTNFTTQNLQAKTLAVYAELLT